MKWYGVNNHANIKYVNCIRTLVANVQSNLDGHFTPYNLLS